MSILLTGGAGFIGSNFAHEWLAASDEPIINLDRLTYAGKRHTLASLQDDPRHLFVHGDIGDSRLVNRLLAEHRPRAVIHFAAETHVDLSGGHEKSNIETVNTVCAPLDELRPKAGGNYADQITHVTARAGRDCRYAIDASKIERELGWRPAETFETGIRKTVQWYLSNPEWIAQARSASSRDGVRA